MKRFSGTIRDGVFLFSVLCSKCTPPTSQDLMSKNAANPTKHLIYGYLIIIIIIIILIIIKYLLPKDIH